MNTNHARTDTNNFSAFINNTPQTAGELEIILFLTQESHAISQLSPHQLMHSTQSWVASL